MEGGQEGVDRVLKKYEQPYYYISFRDLLYSSRFSTYQIHSHYNLLISKFCELFMLISCFFLAPMSQKQCQS